MVKKADIKKDLEEFIKNIEITNDSIQINSLNTNVISDIENSKDLPDGMDLYAFNIITKHLFKIIKADELGIVTDEIKAQFVDKTLNELINAPYKYIYLYEMPSGYDLEARKLDDAGKIEIYIPSQKEASSYKINSAPPPQPVSILSALSGLTNNINTTKIYFKVVDEGYFVDENDSFSLAHYSPQRIYGIYLALHAVFKTYAHSGINFERAGIGRVFDEELNQMAEIPSPINGSGLKFRNLKEKITKIDTLFGKLLEPYKDKKLEFARVQICNSLHWYIQMLNASDVNLKTTYLISAIDALFPQRKNENKTVITPKAPEKSASIADFISNNENEYNQSLGHLEKLFKDRNDVIHGKLEIKGNTLDSTRTQRSSSTLVAQCTGYYLNYISKRISRFFDDPSLN